MIRRFIYKVLLFALPLLLIAGSAEWLVCTRVQNPYRYKHEFLSAHSAEIDTLILGSSHTYYGIVPSEIGRHTFNAANVSQNCEYDLAILQNYDFPNLKCVILPVSYFTFFDPPLEEGDEWNFAVNYKIYMGIDKHPDLSKYNFEIFRFDIFKQKTKTIFHPKPLSCDSLGHGLEYTLENRDPEWEKTGETAATRHTADDFGNVGVQMHYASELIGYCRQKGISVTLITTPAWVTYRSRLDPDQFRRFRLLADRLAQLADTQWHDYMSDTRFTADDFYDADHLNTDGAVKFSRILKEDIGNNAPGH